MDFTGRIMKGYGIVDPAGMAADEKVRYLIAAASGDGPPICRHHSASERAG